MKENLFGFKLSKILVIEDDETQLVTIENSLRKLGYYVTSVQLGYEGIKYYKNNRDCLVLLDYNLPDIDGFKVIQTLQTEGYKVNFITMTAYGNEHVAVDMMKLGARDYIVKDHNFFRFLPSVVQNNINRIETELSLAYSQDILQETQKRYFDLFENSQDAVYFTTLDGKIEGFNNSMLKIFGYSEDEMYNINATNLFVERYKRKELVDEVVSVGFVKEFDVKFLKKDGSILDCLVTANARKNKSGEVVGINGIIHDITFRKQAEKKLAESEERYRNLFERIPLGLYLTTPEGKFIDANPEFLKMAGYSSLTDVMKIDTNLFYLNKSDKENWAQTMEENGIIIDYEFQMRTKSGEPIWVMDTAKAIRDDSGKIVFYEGVLTDTTEKKKIAEEKDKLFNDLKEKNIQIEELANEILDLNYELLEAAEQLKTINAGKDKFFSIIAHDLRSPLTGFIGLTQMINDDVSNLSKDEIFSMTSAMLQSAQYIYELLTNLLEWSRIQGGSLEFRPDAIRLFDLVDYNINLNNTNAIKKFIKIVNNVSPDIIVWNDSNILNTIMRNLINNAVKFTNINGEITISANTTDNNKIELHVQDNGIGMNKETLEKLFKNDVFLTTSGTQKEKGNGIGLVLCKELIEKSKEKISVESIEGKGTKFTITLTSC